MGDMFCKVCGEPWDAYGVQHDFTPSERVQFLDGEGCPACKGKVPESGSPDIETVIWSHVNNQDTDPLETIDRLYTDP